MFGWLGVVGFMLCVVMFRYLFCEFMLLYRYMFSIVVLLIVVGYGIG